MTTFGIIGEGARSCATFLIHLFVESKHLKFSHKSSKGTLSKPSNLMRRGLSGVIGNIIKQKTNEVVTLLSATNNFRTNVSGIVVSRNVTSERFAHRDRFSYGVVTYRVRLLFQSRFGSLHIVNNRHVITVNIGRVWNLNSHHAQLVAKTTERFHALLHCNKLRAKDTGFNRSLLLREPDDRCHIQVNDKTCTRATRQFVPCVIRINVHSEINVLSTGLRSIWR